MMSTVTRCLCLSSHYIVNVVVFQCLILFSDYFQDEIDPLNLPMGPTFTVQPVSVIFDLQRSLQVKSVAFRCEADARPLASYKWFLTHEQQRGPVNLTDQRKTVTSGRLTIDEPSETRDNGDYQCRADNSFGSILSDLASLSFGCKIILFTCKRNCCFSIW